jgi:CelD/BcsL family acetyltransferase involved in cellulose biosynthesis
MDFEPTLTLLVWAGESMKAIAAKTTAVYPRHEIKPRLVAVGPEAVRAEQDILVSVHGELAPLEAEWRLFECVADCTAFQTFDWLSIWQRNIGARQGVKPVISVLRDGGGKLLCILPLAIQTAGPMRRLTWLASCLCDYNAPLLAQDFSRRISPGRFVEIWNDVLERLRSDPAFRHDLIQLDKMPERVGSQANPLCALPVVPNPCHAYMTALGGNWEAFYAAKRSSATRRRYRSKHRHLMQFGEVTFVNAESADEVADSFDILQQQKTRQFARMGVPNLFARPGYSEFFREIATKARGLVHVSRLDVGEIPAAVNLGLTFRGRYYHLLASFTDHELAKYGPGAVHLQNLMAHAIQLGHQVFDFTIGDERYKREWCDSQLKLYDYVAGRTVRGVVVATPLRLLSALKRWIKQTPILWNTVTRMRKLAGSLHSED